MSTPSLNVLSTDFAESGCRWPGGVRNAPELWEFLRDQRNGLQEFNEPRFSATGFYNETPIVLEPCPCGGVFLSTRMRAFSTTPFLACRLLRQRHWIQGSGSCLR